ncbi:MAG: peptidylprolyl isomerase [Clostridia bacterium]|nr:peptidylprolyl isomerase [Clostridia bacterium]
MANNINKKQERAKDREKGRSRYRIFKELRIWVAAALLICIGLTVYVGINRSDTVSTEQQMVEEGTYRDMVALYTEDDSVNAMMLSFWFYRDFYVLIADENFRTDGFGTYGLDPSLPLRGQEYTALRSFYNELMNTVSAAAVTTLQYHELAVKSGTELNDEGKKGVEEEIAQLKAKAKEDGRSLVDYLDYRYCPGMSEDDLRYALEYYYLAEQQYKAVTQAAMECTDEEIAEYYSANKDSLTNANIVRYQFDVKKDENGNVKAEYVALAEKFAACKSSDEFLALIKKELMETHGGTEEQATGALMDYVATVVPGELNDTIESWLYHYDRKAGDTYINYADDYCSVYYIMRAAGKYIYPCVNARMAYLDGEDKSSAKRAAEMYELALESPDEDTFSRLVKEYSQDTSSAYYGGLCENIVPGDLNYKCEEWVFADGRKVGDIGMVMMDGDYYIIYFTGFGEECWKASCRREIVEKKVADAQEAVTSLIDVKTNSNVIDNEILDDRATDRKRGYEVGNDGGKPVYGKQSFISAFNVMIALSVLLTAFAVFCFVYAAKLKKTYQFNF